MFVQREKILLMSNERGHKENMVGTLNAFIVIYLGTWIATIIIKRIKILRKKLIE